ncbi:MAG: sugar transferase [Planctomycetota bacterium]
MSVDEFVNELKKEIYRSDRRTGNRDLPLIRIRISTEVLDRIEGKQFIDGIQQRLRCTDVLGHYEDCIAVLLPETDKEGAIHLANDIAMLAFECNVDAGMLISVYPWDDELVSLAAELLEKPRETSDPGDDHENRDDWDNRPPHDLQLELFENGNADSNLDSLVPSHDRIHFAKHGFVKSQPTPIWKRLIDVIGAGTGILLLTPLFFVAAVAIKWSSPGPIFFRQLREGKDGRQFSILKFRTMVIDAEEKQKELIGLSEQDGPAFKIKNDPRITPVGRYLRKSCVDELPQLFNILIGQMSLVGPRPLPVHESVECRCWQRARLTVLPGLTCIWQARGGRDVRFEDWMRMDLEYIERRSFFYDIRLIGETILIALQHKGSV